MTHIDLRVAPEALTLCLPDGKPVVLPSIWLRDNCPSGFHPDTGERTFDLLSVPETPQIEKAALHGESLEIDWQGGHQSRFCLDWIEAHRPGQTWHDPAAIPPYLWPEGQGVEAIPRHPAEALMQSDSALVAWMQDTARFGLSIVEGLEQDEEAGMRLADRIGFLRRTNFGKTFEVVSKPDPNNLAYTAHALPLHTDLPNQEVPPGYQFLHCLANEAQGGGSVFADGFALAEHLRMQNPEAYGLLCETPIPFRFFDGETDLRVQTPVIVTEASGALREIRYNAHIADIFDMPAERLPAFYAAYRAYMALTRDATRQITPRLSAGEMVVFDNRRILHGREAFDPTTGFRHLKGCYVDRGEFRSRLRVLDRKGRDLYDVLTPCPGP